MMCRKILKVSLKVSWVIWAWKETLEGYDYWLEVHQVYKYDKIEKERVSYSQQQYYYMKKNYTLWLQIRS